MKIEKTEDIRTTKHTIVVDGKKYHRLEKFEWDNKKKEWKRIQLNWENNHRNLEKYEIASHKQLERIFQLRNIL